MLAQSCPQEALTSVPNTRGEIVFQHGKCELPTSSFVEGRGGGRWRPLANWWLMWAWRKDEDAEICFVMFVGVNLPQEENRSESSKCVLEFGIPCLVKVACLPGNLVLRVDRSSILFSKCDAMWENCGLLTTAVKSRAWCISLAAKATHPLDLGCRTRGLRLHF